MIARLREAAGMAILLVEQYDAFARELAQGILVMDRGSVVFAGGRRRSMRRKCGEG